MKLDLTDEIVETIDASMKNDGPRADGTMSVYRYWSRA